MTCDICQLEQTSQTFPLCNFTDSSGSKPDIDLFCYRQKNVHGMPVRFSLGLHPPPHQIQNCPLFRLLHLFTALSLLLFHHYSSLSPSQTSPYKTMLLALKVVSLFIQSSSLNSPSSANPSHVPHTSLTPALLSNTYIPLREWETLYLDTYLSFFSLSHLFLALCCVI